MVRLLSVSALCLFVGVASTQDPPKTAPDLKSIADKVEKLEQDLKDFRNQNVTTNLSLAGIETSIRDLRRQLDDLAREIRVSQSPKQMATLRLVNEHTSEKMDVFVEGMSYSLKPGSSQTVMVGAGEVKFQVRNLDENPRVRSIAAGATLLVTMK